jgi:hypothetical protein
MSTEDKPDAVGHLQELVERSVPELIERDPQITVKRLIEIQMDRHAMNPGPDAEADALVKAVITCAVQMAHAEYQLRRAIKNLPAEVARAYDWSNFVA